MQRISWMEKKINESVRMEIWSRRRRNATTNSDKKEARILWSCYASPAWWEFAGQRLERLVARLRRMGYLPTDFPSVETLAEEADRNLFKTISQCPSHVLRHLLTDKPTSSRSLRVRAHNFVLPPKDNRNFLSRALYNAICPPMGDA